MQGNKATAGDNAAWIGNRSDFTAWNFLDGFGGNQVLKTNEAVFSIVTRLSNTLSSLPIHEYHQYEECSTPLIDLLRVQPNPNMTAFEMLNMVEAARNVDGNGYILIERDPKTLVPVNLWPIDPGYVTIKRNIDDGSIWYDISSPQFNCIVYNTDIIHVKHVTAVGDVYGISPIDVLRGALKFQHEVQEFSLSEMSKKDAYIVKYDRSMKPETANRTLKAIRNMIKANGGAVLTQAGYSIDRFESKFKPAELSDTEAISRIRIANAFNVPLSFLNDGQAKNTVNVEHVMTQFVETTLLPIIRQYESEFNRKLLTTEDRVRGFYFKFNVNGLMRGDTAARTQFYQMMIRNGIATQNELRKLEDMAPLKEKSADVVWISKDLFPSENQYKASDIQATLTPAENNLSKDTDNNLKGGENDDQTSG
ncbi:phage portal protein [Lactobacillus sp. PV037]|nr:phage portal protein [Lactobacillus sp. PV037]